jgi:predicted amidohydrolase YtcJ
MTTRYGPSRRRAAHLVLAALWYVSWGSPLPGQAPPPPRADLILTDGKIFTGDSTNPWVTAVAIRGERVMAIGSTADMLLLSGPRTQRVRLDGRVVIPGINDAHDHLGGELTPGSWVRTSASPTPNDALALLQDSLRVAVRRAPPDTWLTASIGIALLDDAGATRAALDAIAPRHPVLLLAWWGHGVILNSAGMQRLGVADSVRDPLGGWVSRDASGSATGRFDEYAGWDLSRRAYSAMTADTIAQGLHAYAAASLRLGVTSVQNMASTFAPSLTVRAFRAANLAMRVRLVRWPIAAAGGRNAREWDTVTTTVGPRVTVSGRKWVLDATPIDGFALRRSPYPNRPEWYGRLNFPIDTVRAMLAEALEPGAAQLHLHITGDSTMQLVLHTMTQLAADSVWRTKRVRFEHGNGITGPAVERARRLGVVVAQPRQHSAPLNTWLEAGIPVAYGSDGLRNPFQHLMAFLAPTNNPGEAISREAALTILTRGGAYAEFAEGEKGTLAPGMLADLAVLSQDIFTVPLPALPRTTSVLTVVGGRVVFNALSK